MSLSPFPQLQNAKNELKQNERKRIRVISCSELKDSARKFTCLGFGFYRLHIDIYPKPLNYMVSEKAPVSAKAPKPNPIEL